MKLAALFVVYTTLAASVSAFGVTRQSASPRPVTSSAPLNRSPLQSTFNVPMVSGVRDPIAMRLGMAKEKEEVFYDIALKVAPKTTKSLTSMVGYALCDLLAQVSLHCLIRYISCYDLIANMRLLASSALASAFILLAPIFAVAKYLL